MIPIQVWADKFAKGWDGDPSEIPQLQRQAELDEVLVATFDSDAHFVPYVVVEDGEIVDDAPRVNKAALPALEALGVELLFSCVPVDVDAPKGADVDAWHVEQLKVLEAQPELRASWHYRTRGGYRLIYRLDDPVGPLEYEKIGRAVRALIRSKTGGAVDPDELPDFTRCYRLPFVVRDGVAQRYAFDTLDAPPLSSRDLLAKPAETANRFDGLADAGPVKVSDGLTEGGRNKALASAAGVLRRAGFDETEIRAALAVANERRCDPPLPTAEVATIAKSISRYDAPTFGVDPRADLGEQRTGGDVDLELGSEAEIADVVLDKLEDGPKVRYDRGSLWRYGDGGVWGELRPSTIVGEVSGLDGAPVGPPGKGRKYLKVGARMCSHVTELIQSYRDAPGWLGRRPPGVAFANGVVRLDGGELSLVDHAPDHKLTHALPFAWDPTALCPTLDRVVERAFRGTPDAADREELLAGFIGICLVGMATVYQQAILLVGEGANGKSTILDAISALFPATARASTPPQQLGHEYHRASLANTLINIVAEVPESDIVAAAAFRAMVDGSEVTARQIYGAPFTYRPVAGHVWAANNLPGSKDFSHAFWRRWLALEFPNVIPQEEQERGLGAKIASEEPGVARWALTAAARVQAREGYKIPESSQRVIGQWRKNADQVAAFAEERLEASKETKTAGSRVYESYVLWSRRNGHRSLSSRKFADRLRKLGFERPPRGHSARSWFVEIQTAKNDGINATH